MKTAKRIDEFTPKEVYFVVEDMWMSVELDNDNVFEHYKSLPEIVEYEGTRFYKMSYNSDNFLAHYMEAKDKPFHLRYSS